MTGKIKILMEFNAAPPMAQYSIVTKGMGNSTSTPVSSLAASKKAASTHHPPAMEPTTRDGNASAGHYRSSPQVVGAATSEDSDEKSDSSETTLDYTVYREKMEKENSRGSENRQWNSESMVTGLEEKNALKQKV